jgi:hypothetical protein
LDGFSVSEQDELEMRRLADKLHFTIRPGSKAGVLIAECGWRSLYACSPREMVLLLKSRSGKRLAKLLEQGSRR